VPSALAALDATVGEAMLDRREFLTMTTDAVAALAARWVGAPMVPFPAEALRAGTVDDLATSFDSLLPGLRAFEDEHGGGHSRPVLDAALRTVRELLKQPIGSTGRKRLLRTAAELARLAGWASFDAGMLAASEAYFRAGLEAAQAVGDRTAGANIIKSMSLLYAESGRAQDALTLISTARQVTRSSPPRVRAMLAVREARVRALLGHTDQCDDLLGASASLLERALSSSGDSPPEIAYFGPAELAAQTAVCHQILGRHERTSRLLESAVEIQPHTRDRDRTTYLLWQAESALALRAVEHSCDLLRETIPAVRAASSVRNRSRLRAVRQQLTAYQHVTAVQDLDDWARV
jgi:tetratricopeptide (TPR) repeat protein